ncbi:WG containing repeat-containing protein [Dyadobacter soli]|uniref:WG containing repeat-containing protein n=1 Tax=Dyadobacter soli TaxID=659014 RepID=A0A1G7DVK3_9BACT|nr:WG repeat-containing protein [Dyadobacter soli]SDE55206.1 WG containing repeat-containing protein [Dyadobacter soli]
MFKIPKKYLWLILLGNLACSGLARRKDEKRRDLNVKASITAVMDTTDGTKYLHYYKLANGQVVGQDSIYAFDAIFDCESDGKIRFHDRITDKVGFFDNNGRVVVPAVYNDASRFQNGMAMVIKDAKRVGWDGEDCEKGDCEHWSWEGGSMLLINARNEVLVDKFEMEGYSVINWYSLQMMDIPGDTSLYRSVKGRGEKWYVFVDYEKEFDRWFREEYLAASQDPAKLREFAHDSLVNSLPEYEEWVRMSGDEFIQKCGNRLTSRLQPIRDRTIRIFTGLTMFGLNPYIHTGPSFEPFFDGCIPGDAGRYPAFDVTSNFMDKSGKLEYQEQYSFLRTDNGYKLIGVSWRNP